MTDARAATAASAGPEPLFALDRVRFHRQGREILPPLSLSLAPGEVHALIGPNGSGKSTLVNLMARQLRPAGGTISFLGRPLDSYGERELARRLAFMPQFTPPADGMEVRDLVALGRYAWHGTLGRFGADDRRHVDQALEATGLAAHASRPVDTLSGGERQRAWLAMMLAQDTGCLLLDEPTSALDIAHQADMLDLVRRLARQRGLGAIVVLHDINMAARVADRLIALGGGRIVAEGAPEDVMRPEVLERIYGIGMGIHRHPDTGAPLGYVR